MTACETWIYDQCVDTSIQEHNILIPMRDGFENQAIVFQRKLHDREHPAPLVILTFGGGWVSGGNKQLSAYSRGIAHLYGAVVVNISYRLAPEHPFPKPSDDAWDNLLWLAQNAHTLGADVHAGLVLGGSSAGANLTAILASKCSRIEGSPKITGIFLSVPLVLVPEIVPAKYKAFYTAREDNKSAPLLDAQGLDWVMKGYQPDIYSPEFSPFNHLESVSGLPRTYVQACGLDPLRDDALIYEKLLREHDVPVRCDTYPGVPHSFQLAFFKLTQTFKCNADILTNFGWLLGEEVSRDEIEAYMNREWKFIGKDMLE